jgi:hypothetical protein
VRFNSFIGNVAIEDITAFGGLQSSRGVKRLLCFQISSFTCSNKKEEQGKS